MALSSPPESLPEVLDSAPLRDYQSKITELQRQLAELGVAFEPGYYKVQKVQAQIATLEEAFERERANVLKRIRNEFEDARRREDLLTASYTVQAKLVSEQASKAVHYDILKREVDTNRQLYEGVLQKVKQAGVLSALPPANVRVVDAAEPASQPSKPKPFENALIGLLGGVCMGVAAASVRARALKTFQEPGETASALDVPELGAIVSGDSDRKLFKNEANGFISSAPERNGLLPVSTGGLTQQSLLADSFRAAVVSLRYSADGCRVVAIVSAAPSEGKSTITSNMGITLAGLDSRVLLIDGDLRHPTLHSRFGIDNAHGLSDLFRDDARHGDRSLIRPTPVKHLHILPAGPLTHDTAILYSERMADLIQQVRGEFDYILIDTPPMLHIPDARAVAKLADGVVIVIRANQTDRDAVWTIRKRLDDDGTPVIGTILNGWNPKKSRSYYYRAASDYGSRVK
jgi:polysaccharide biosynthesis transport protein